MKQRASSSSRREFIQVGATAIAGIALNPFRATAVNTAGAKVAIAKCSGYGPEVRAAYARCFDLLGGIGSLVRDKTVTIKINLTGSDFKKVYGKTVGETYMTHPETAMALTSALFDAGARRVRFVESTQLRQDLDVTMANVGFDMNALMALGKVEAENTRNLGKGRDYATLKVPGGYMFESFDLNHSYADTDVFISLCKMKTHATTGITLTMKNLFGITPNSLYGDEAPGENATQGRSMLHCIKKPFVMRQNSLPYAPPGAKEIVMEKHDGGFRIPRILVDLNTARPIHLAIIDGISAINRGEGPWINDKPQRYISAGVLIVGLNAVATDTVGTAVMGFPNVRAPRGQTPFEPGDNHLVLAEQAGLGPADLSKIEVVGESIEKVCSKQYVSCAPPV